MCAHDPCICVFIFIFLTPILVCRVVAGLCVGNACLFKLAIYSLKFDTLPIRFS